MIFQIIIIHSMQFKQIIVSATNILRKLLLSRHFCFAYMLALIGDEGDHVKSVKVNES